MSPLVGPNDDALGPRFPDMSDAYDPVLRAGHASRDRARPRACEGVYGAWLGPQFETPAEIRFMRAIGCDLAGMSTAPEVIAARHLEVRCLGISVVTNMAAGVVEGKLGHEEVLQVGAEAQPRLTALLRALLPSRLRRRRRVGQTGRMPDGPTAARSALGRPPARRRAPRGEPRSSP